MSAGIHGTAARVPGGDLARDYDLARGLSEQLAAAMPGLLAAEPGAVQAALDVVADVLGGVLGQARLGLAPEDYRELAVAALLRADHVAAARQEAALAGIARCVA